jgi:hypothetical protein
MNLSVQNQDDGFRLLGCQIMMRRKQTDLRRATKAIGRVALAWSSSAWPMYLIVGMSVQPNGFRCSGQAELSGPPKFTLVLLWLIILSWTNFLEAHVVLAVNFLFAFTVVICNNCL